MSTSASEPKPLVKIAVVHDWLNGMRGGEKVLEAILELYPTADIFTLFCEREKLSYAIRARKIFTSALQKIPFGISKYRHFLPLMPYFISRFDLSSYDLIVSSSHCVAKGVKKRRDAVHVSYVHAPMRYMWDRFQDYFGPGRAGLITRLVAWTVRYPLRIWDRSVSVRDRVDLIIANSQFIADQVEKNYGRQAQVIHPFVDLERFKVVRNPQNYFLIFGAFAPYKRVDIAIEACLKARVPLVIAGGGQDLDKLKQIAPPNHPLITWRENPSDSEVKTLYSECRALLFPGVEDFGITPLEAMASGAPVIAYGVGGATETVTRETGVFFSEQTVESLREAILDFNMSEKRFVPQILRARAEEFSKTRFQDEFKIAVKSVFYRP